ncbi:hypothetical protein [Saccharopolyspora spinosa]|uniref:hypothetical protein n=1 Tax=Saccharopolyspora spinosa TaxID=60894 RepID=UPI00376EA64E
MPTPTDQATQQDERATERKEKKKARDAKYRQRLRAAADRVAVLEELAGRGPLTEEQAAELAALQPKVAQRKQKTKERHAKEYQARKAAAERVVVLEELAGRGSWLRRRRRSWRRSSRRWRNRRSKRRKITRSSIRRERVLPIGLWCWRS